MSKEEGGARVMRGKGKRPSEEGAAMSQHAYKAEENIVGKNLEWNTAMCINRNATPSKSTLASVPFQILFPHVVWTSSHRLI